MCFYSNVDIRQALGRNDPYGLSIQPFRYEHLQAASYDLTLAGEFQRPNCPKVTADELTLEPLQCVLAASVEYLALGAGVVASVEGRSSVGRLFVIPHTAGWADPGFCGDLTLEIVNLSPAPYTLKAGDRICQIAFARTLTPADPPYRGKYQGQRGVTASRLYLDPDYRPR